MTSWRKVVLTGGPHGGKTTLFEGLKSVVPEASYVAEPATSVLRQTQDYSLLEDPARFCTACISWSLDAEAVAVKDANLVIQDRSVVDTVAYARRDNCRELLEVLPSCIQAARYSLALVCEPVGEYSQSDIRTEDRQMAAQIHDMLLAAYDEFAVPAIIVPALPLNERLQFVTEAIENHPNPGV